MANESQDENSPRDSRRNSIRSYVSDLICDASSAEEFDALKIMADNPEIREHRTLVLDLAYEEFCRKKENGDPIQQSSFAKRFPDFEESLMRVFQVHQYLESFEQRKDKPKVEWPKPGDLFGGYRLLELIGRGSFAFVFIAEQLNVAERKVVLKVTRNALDEVATLGQLEHPNIVQIYTVESDVDGFTAICMPLISQVTLFDVVSELHGYGGQPDSAEDFVKALEQCVDEREEFKLNRSKLPFGKKERFIDAALHVGVDIAKALAYSHKKNLLHCDVKPTNILITPDGRSMLFDFNLSAKSNSKTGRIGGTLPYMPPEQLKALIDGNYDFEATPAVDIYSFGVTLYQLITGKLPYGDVPETSSQKEAAKLLLDRQQKKDVSFAGIKGINRSLQHVIKKCLAYQPLERPASAGLLAIQLEREQKVVKRTRRWMISHPVKAFIALMLLISIIPISYFGVNFVAYEIPKRLALDFIRKGQDAERIHNFNQAVDHYQSALKRSEAFPKVRYQSLCQLAIVYAKHDKPSDAARIMAKINDEFALFEVDNAKIELALMACTDDEVSDIEFQRANKIEKLLKEEGEFSIDDYSNVNSFRLMYYMYQRNRNTDFFVGVFKDILKRHPNHAAANFNLFRLERNLIKSNELLDETPLLRCIDATGDKPTYVRFLFRNKALKLESGKCDVEDFIQLFDRFAKCGGSKTDAIDVAKSRIPNRQLRKRIIEHIDSVQFDAIDIDKFLGLGVSNPISTISFD